MDLSNYEVPRVLVTCRSRMGLIKIIGDLIMGTQRERLFRNTCFGDETENVLLYYHIFDNFQIQFRREEFCLVTGLKFGVEYWDDYNDEDEPIPFRRRVFPSSLDGKHITGKNVEDLIKGKSFIKLDDDDAVNLCCIGILQLMLLGAEDRRAVPNLILRLVNDRVGWDDYSWGSYVWPTLYYQLRDANVKRWLLLYATEPTKEVDKKSYSIFGFTWAFKTWVLEVFRERPNEYYTRHMRYPRVVAWSSNKKFYRHMLRDFLHGQNIFEKMNKFMEDMSVGMEANKEPIIVYQHYGISYLSGFQSIRTLTNHSFFNMGTPINWKTPRPSQPGSSNWQIQMPAYTPTPNWQSSIPSHPGDAGLCHPRPRREQRPSVYMQSPYTPLPPTMELPKKRVGKTKKKCQNDNLSPLNLGNASAYDNAGEDDVVITGVHDTGIYFTYENVDPNKVTGAVNLPHSVFYVFDSMESERTRLLLEHQIKAWTPVINGILQMRGYFYGSE
uniref:Phospholipase-like protein n=1 Tax=Tanacetum cinerariifolium TaxID=118510 RepID=A0A6L2K206_TANCI|nr:phospholipase-like protein [Tanacetum cinerariifolium]